MNDPANMTVAEASFYVWSHQHHMSPRGHLPPYVEAEGALRCAIAIKHGCVGLPKCNPAQCRCGAVRNPGPVRDNRPNVRRTWTPEHGWVHVEVRV